MKTPRFVPAAAAALALSLPAMADLNDDLFSYWSFDGNLTDAVGGFNGTLAGGGVITYDAGKFGQGIDLNGAGQYIAIPGSSISHRFRFDPWTILGGAGGTLDLSGGDCTVSAWFRVDAFDKAWQTLIARGEGNHWRIARSDIDTAPAGGARNQLAYAGGAADIPNPNTGLDVNNGQLRHVVVVTQQTSDMRLYVDGKLVAIGNPPQVGNDARIDDMRIGSNPNAANREWNGLIDDVLIWSRALTDGECRGLYNSGAGISGADIVANGGAAVADADADGLPKWWEEAYGLSDSDNGTTDLNNGPNGDPDADGVINSVEFAKRSVPKDPTDGFATDINPADSDGDGISDSEELAPGVDGFITDPASKDSDKDGLSDVAEIAGGITSPSDPDTDNDGAHDGVDVLPLDPNSNTDTDPWTDLQEFNGTFNPFKGGVNTGIPGDPTSPLAADTDGDTINDHLEVDGSRAFITDPNNADTDGDGVPDAADIDPLNPNSDTDGDSWTDLAEASGTFNPWRQGDTLVPTGVPGRPTNGLFTDTDNDALSDPEEVGGSVPGGFITDPNRADTDGDGLSDGEEFPDFMTSPLNPDSDADTVRDGDEVRLGSNPNVPDDSDGDGLSNLKETNGTDNPWNAGVASGPPGEPTSPLTADSDGDGIRDGEEMVAGADTFVTDPNKSDTDGDGFADGLEVGYGKDPTNAASKPPAIVAGLVGYWPFDGNLTETSLRHPAGTHDGVQEGPTALTFTARAGFGQAVQTNSNTAVRVKNSGTGDGDPNYRGTFDASLNGGTGTGAMTISFWALNSPFPGTWAGWVSKFGENGQGYQIRRQGNSPNGCFTIRGMANEDPAPAGSFDLQTPASRWIHIVGVWNGNAGTRKLYINGVEDPRMTRTDDDNLMNLAAAHSLAFGARDNGAGAGGFGNFTSATMDDVAIWDRPLTIAEIFTLSIDPLSKVITNPDTDGDGLLDIYETNNGLFLGSTSTGTKPNNPDSDGDTVGDLTEVLARTSGAFPTANPNADDDPDGDLLFNSVEGNGTANPWTNNVEGAPPGERTDPFDADSDNDNLSDVEEVIVGIDGFVTNPNNPDTDGDGVIDGSDANPRDANSDSDGDTLTDIAESSGSVNPWKQGDTLAPSGVPGRPTNPLASDSDGDGLSDFAEINPTAPRLQTDPNRADSDSDGLSDGVESNSGTFASASDTGSNPLDADSDNDNFGDFLEVSLASDPNSAASVPTVPDLSPGLIGYWEFENNLSETSGAHPAGTHDGVAVNGTVPFIASVNPGLGQAINLVGNGANAVRVRNTDSLNEAATYVNTFDDRLNTTRQMTISFWARGLPGDWNPYVSKRGEGTLGYQMRKRNAGFQSTFTIRGVGGDADPIGTINITANQPRWIHFVAVWDGITGLRKVYINGVEDIGQTLTNSTGAFGIANQFSLVIGARDNDTSAGGIGNALEGYVDDVAFWDRALTQTEVDVVYGGSVGGASVGTLIELAQSQQPGPIPVTSFGFNGAGDFELSSNGLNPAKSYVLQRSVLLNGTDWTTIDGPITGVTTATLSDTNPPAAKAFYVIRQLP